MAAVFEGIRVIDLSKGLAGPGTSMYLADQGAEVVKIELPKAAGARGNSADPVLGDITPGFLVLNRNKRGITLDLHKPEGRAVLHRLVERSDVLVCNMRTAAAARAGADYPTLRAVNPRLIYGHITAFGAKGPYAGKPGYDRLTQGLSGAMYRRWEDGTPATSPVFLSDPSVPMLMAYGITLALLQRERTGLGQRVETSLLQAAIAMQSSALVRVEKAKRSLNEVESATYGIYRCADGAYINITALQARQFTRMCSILGLDDLGSDPRAFDLRRKEEFRADAYPRIKERFATRPSREWLALLDEQEVPAAPILEKDQVFTEPQMVENQMFVRVDHPEAGAVDMFAPPIHLSESQSTIRRPAPALGQHTDEVLQELGYSAGEIEELRRQAVI